MYLVDQTTEQCSVTGSGKNNPGGNPRIRLSTFKRGEVMKKPKNTECSSGKAMLITIAIVIVIYIALVATGLVPSPV